MTAKEFNRRHKQKRLHKPKPTMRTGDGIPQVLATDKAGSAYVDVVTKRTYFFVNGHWIGSDGARVTRQPIDHLTPERLEELFNGAPRAPLNAYEAWCQPMRSQPDWPRNAALRQSNQSAVKKPEPKPRKDEAVSGAAGRVIRFEPEP